MTPQEIVRVIEAALKYTHELLNPPLSERTELLIAFGVNGRARLYYNPGASDTVIPADRESHCVGIAYGLGLYFARSLFREGMSIRWAKIIAAHLIKNAKKYSNGFCGGDTHLFELPDVGDPKWTKDQREIAELESYLEPLEQVMPMVLPDKKTNDETLKLRLNTMIAAMKKGALSQVIPVGPAEFNVQAGPSDVYSIDHIPTPLISYRPQEPKDEK